MKYLDNLFTKFNAILSIMDFGEFLKNSLHLCTQKKVQ